MKQCKACLEMYDLPNPSKYGFFGDHCPKCGTFNSDFNKNLILSAVVLGIIFFKLLDNGILTVELPFSIGKY